MHDLVKKEIHRGQHFSTAAEILTHGDELVFFVSFWNQGKRLILPLEKIGIGQAEAVDALLHITHSEAAPGAGHQGKDSLLHAVGVLILVHHHLFEFFTASERRFTGHIAGRLLSQAFPVSAEDLQGVMFQIIEIQHIALLLKLAQGRHKVQGQVRKTPDCGTTLPHHSQGFFLAVLEIISAQSFDSLLQSLMPGIKGFPQGRIFLLQGLVDLGIGEPPGLEVSHSPGQSLPVPACLKYILHGAERSLQHLAIRGQSRGHRIFIWRICFPQGTGLQPAGKILCLSLQGFPCLLNTFPKCLPPGRIPDALRLTALIPLSLLSQPGLRPRLALAELIEAQDCFVDCLITMVISVVIGKGQKLLKASAGFLIFGFRSIALTLRLMVMLLQHFLQHITLHEHHFLLTGQPELGINLYSFYILAYDALAKYMEGADGSPRQEHALPVQPGYLLSVFCFKQTLLKRGTYTLPHFRSGGIGESHHQQFINAALPLQQAADDAVYQHPGLARAGSSSHQDIAVTGIDGFYLIISVWHLSNPLFPSIPPSPFPGQRHPSSAGHGRHIPAHWGQSHTHP